MPKLKSKQPAWFFLLGITTHLVVKHGPLNILLCSALCSLGIKGVRDGERQVFLPTHSTTSCRTHRKSSSTSTHRPEEPSFHRFVSLVLTHLLLLNLIVFLTVLPMKPCWKDLNQLRLLFKGQFYKYLYHGSELWESAAKQSNICSLKSLAPNQTLPKKHSPDPLTLTCLSKLRNRNYFHFIFSHSPWLPGSLASCRLNVTVRSLAYIKYSRVFLYHLHLQLSSYSALKFNRSRS